MRIVLRAGKTNSSPDPLKHLLSTQGALDMCATQIPAGTIRYQHLPLCTNTKKPSSSGMLRLEIPCPQTHVWRPGDCSEKEKPMPHCASLLLSRKTEENMDSRGDKSLQGYTQPWSRSSPENLSSSSLQAIHSLVVQEPRSGKQKLTHWEEMESPEFWGFVSSSAFNCPCDPLTSLSSLSLVLRRMKTEDP